MADLADVEHALVGAVSAALYPAGVSAGPMPASVAGPPVRVRRGWPLKESLDADLKQGIANVTVYSVPGSSRLTTRYPEAWRVAVPAVTTISALITGNQVVFSGTTGIAQLVGIRCGGVPYVVLAAPQDTPASVAAALAALIPGASSMGATVTVPNTVHLTARVIGYATLTRELRRQLQALRVTCWCPDSATRDGVAAAVDLAFAKAKFVVTSDQSACRLLYAGTYPEDGPSKDALWRRDLRYSVDYPTTERKVAPAMLWGVVQDLGSSTLVV